MRTASQFHRDTTPHRNCEATSKQFKISNLQQHIAQDCALACGTAGKTSARGRSACTGSQSCAGGRFAQSAPDHEAGESAKNKLYAHEGPNDPVGGGGAIPQDDEAQHNGKDSVEKDPDGAGQVAVAEESEDTDRAQYEKHDPEDHGEGDDTAHQIGRAHV